MPDFIPEKFEPIKNIEFEAEQNWFGNTLNKIEVNFEKEEDMMLLILNIFVHDFGHDYNFLGESYLRRIVSNIRQLELLGIENGEKILKVLVDKISSEPRVPFMYNDNIFVDDADPAYFSEALKNKKQKFFERQKFYERLYGFEEIAQKQKRKQEEQKEAAEEAAKLSKEERVLLLTGKEKDKAKIEGGERVHQLEDRVKEFPESEKKILKIEHPGTGSLEVEVVPQPSLSPLKIDISDYIKARANDPESLEMLSTLKLYITSYLGPNYYTSRIPETVAPTSDAFYKYYMHFSVITTFYGLICYYDEIVEDEMVDETLSILTTLFSDLLLILLASYLEFVNSEGDDYFSREDALDPLSILDSTQVMDNYNRLFVEYVQASESEFDDFKSRLLSDYEIIEDTEEVKEGGFGPGSPEGTPPEEPIYRRTYVKRQYGVFHNNLLTTVARGIFLKTGVWQKIYPPAPGEKAKDFPSQFVYNPADSKNISQQFEEWKTTELSLITSITRDSLKARGFKNDLLIAEILILKHMLIEILPDFLYLANGIDDRLRNFLEVYLYKCGNYDANLKELSQEDQAILDAALEQEATEADLKFIVGDDEEAEEEKGGSVMKGGVNYGEGTIYNFQRKMGSYELPTKLVEKKKPQPLSKEDVERAFKLNNDVITNLTESGIPPIVLEDGTEITNMFDLLKMNTGMIKREGSDFAFPAPKRKFILDNASTLTRNVNGLKLFHDKVALEDLERTLSREEYDELLKKFRSAQKFFGLYKTLKRGVVCAGSSMLDAMDNCSLDKGTTEPKEVGTTNFEFVFDDQATGAHFSYGGVVLFYKGTNKDGEENINVHIDFSLRTRLSRDAPDDVAHVLVDELDVADSEDLKARIVYKSVIEEVNDLFKSAFRFEEVPGPVSDEQLDQEFIERMRELAIIKMRSLWSFLQYNPYSRLNPVFNRLLGKTGVKNLGDLLQETQGTIKWGGYVNTIAGMDAAVQEFIRAKRINVDEDIIWRSVSKKDSIIPYDENGDALRLAVEGDRPSAFRAIYFVLFALTKGPTEGINSMTISGYLNGLRSILVSRNLPYIDVEPPPQRPELVGPTSFELILSDSDEEGDVLAQEQEQARMEADALAQPTAKSKPKRSKDLTKEESEEIARAKADAATEALNLLQLEPCPIPYGKVVYVNSEKKNINFKATVINDPQIKRPKTLEEQVKKLTEAKAKTKSTKPPGAALSPEQTTDETRKLERDLKDLISQVTIGNSIEKLSELQAQAERAEVFATMPFSEGAEGGKTRKNKKPLKKKTTTRNKNKTKKAKKGKKTIKRRNKEVKRKPKKTR